MKLLLVYPLAALFEIAGCFASWTWWRLDPIRIAVPGRTLAEAANLSIRALNLSRNELPNSLPDDVRQDRDHIVPETGTRRRAVRSPPQRRQ